MSMSSWRVVFSVQNHDAGRFAHAVAPRSDRATARGHDRPFAPQETVVHEKTGPYRGETSPCPVTWQAPCADRSAGCFSGGATVAALPPHAASVDRDDDRVCGFGLKHRPPERLAGASDVSTSSVPAQSRDSLRKAILKTEDTYGDQIRVNRGKIQLLGVFFSFCVDAPPEFQALPWLRAVHP